MSVFAGVFARRPEVRITDDICAAVERALSRHPNETYERFRDAKCFLCKVDVGAYGEPAFNGNSTTASMLTGEPLLAHAGSGRRSRSIDLDELTTALVRDDHAVLHRARGVFGLALYDAAARSLTLATDKLGIRPVYYWLDDNYVVFGSALRILEEIPLVPKVMDVRAVAEVNAFGFAIADRTPYSDIRLLGPGDLIRIDARSARIQRYWRWDHVKRSSAALDQLIDSAYETFMEAISLRCGGDKTTIAFLSGGLDSRTIVTALQHRGLRVHTFNFSVKGLQDQVFSRLFAERAATLHTESPMTPTQSVTARLMANAIGASKLIEQTPPERPQLVWSGDGGSVTVGHVYLNPAMIEKVRAGDISGAMDLGVNGWGSPLPHRLITSDVLEVLDGAPRRALLDEFNALASDDAGRALHLVLMLNDQHRHLAQHFEDIDQSRLEYQLPFFDSSFVESVLKIPIEESLRHQLYMKWLKRFPELVTSVPWQAYPGHEPCPLPAPSGVVYQWGKTVSRYVRNAERRDLVEHANRILGAKNFPRAILRKSYLRAAKWMYQLRLRDVGYVLRSAKLFFNYWTKSDGRYTPPG